MNLSLTLNLPPEVEERLRAESGDLSSAVRESFAINLFRRGILTHHQLGQVLGIDRFETDALLKRNGVTEYSLTHEDIDADVSSLKEFLGLPDP
jgi:predicted HTH domain antitoxin